MIAFAARFELLPELPNGVFEDDSLLLRLTARSALQTRDAVVEAIGEYADDSLQAVDSDAWDL